MPRGGDEVVWALTDNNVSALREMIEKLAPVCERAGVRRVRVGEVEMEFGAKMVMDPKTMEEFTKRFMESQPTEEQVLFHSAPDFVRDQPAPPPPTARTARRR